MSAIEFLSHFLEINSCSLTKKEALILEAELINRLCAKLKEIFRLQYENYFRVMKFNASKEDAMLEDKFLQCIINDILASEEYTLSGISYYSHIPEEVVFEVATGQNTSPSITFFRRIIELHRSVRPNLYREIINKISLELPERQN